MALIILSNIHSEILFKDYGNAEGWPLIIKVYPSLRARLEVLDLKSLTPLKFDDIDHIFNLLLDIWTQGYLLTITPHKSKNIGVKYLHTNERF